ncbi:MAG: phage tail protein [Bacteroidetes bacterium]|nr:phage tail protein [Bacteroidota bacterium]
MEGVIGYTTCFAGNFAPKNWAFCQGQIINIASNTALFSILGTVYGGNGTTTFALPDLRGRTVVGAGTGPGLSSYSLGQMGGSTQVAITTAQMPAHVHPVSITAAQNTSNAGSAPNPGGGVFATTTNGGLAYAGAPSTYMLPFSGSITMTPTGSNVPVGVQNPVLGLNYIICQYGVYPARN